MALGYFVPIFGKNMKNTLKKILVFITLTLFVHCIAWANEEDILDTTTDSNGKSVRFGYEANYRSIPGYYVRLTNDPSSNKWSVVDISTTEKKYNQNIVVIKVSGNYVMPAVSITAPVYGYINYASRPSNPKRNGPNTWFCSGGMSDICNKTPFSIKTLFSLTGTWRTYDFVLMAKAYQEADVANQMKDIVEKDKEIRQEKADADDVASKARAEENNVKVEEKRVQKLRQKVVLIDQVKTFRASIKVASESHCGLVIEVKTPIAKIETGIGEKWLKVDQLYPKGLADCRFTDGIYQDTHTVGGQTIDTFD